MSEAEPIHSLVIGQWIEDEDRPEWTITHPEGCDLTLCPVHYQIEEAGIDAFGMTTSGTGDTWHIDRWPQSLPKEPGEYPIEFWHTETYIWDSGAYEYDAGLVLSEPKERVE
jgi:hypothetical protein